MKRKVFLSLMTLFCAYTSLIAQEIETFYLRNGSAFNGHILEQVPGKSIILSSDDVRVPESLRLVDVDIYEIYWNDISYIEKKDRSDLLLSGTNSLITLKNGKSYEGFIKEIHPGQLLKLKDDSNKTYEFSYSDIKTIETIVINSNQPFLEQFYHKDIIILKNGKTKNGFIVKQNIGESLSVVMDDGNDIEIQLTDISRMKKSVNEDYKPIYDIVLQPGQFVHNKIDIIFQNIEPTPANIYIVNIESQMIDAYVGQKVSIHSNLVDKEAKINAIKAVKITRKEGLGNKENHYETFKMEDFANSNIVIEKSEVSKVGTTEFSFIPSETGYYVLQVSNINGFIIVRVS